MEHQGYGPPKDADIEWAEVIGLALEAADRTAKLDDFVKQLESLRAADASSAKTVYVLGGTAEMPSVAYARQTLVGLGFLLGGAEMAAVDVDSAKAAGKDAASL